MQHDRALVMPGDHGCRQTVNWSMSLMSVWNDKKKDYFSIPWHCNRHYDWGLIRGHVIHVTFQSEIHSVYLCNTWWRKTANTRWNRSVVVSIRSGIKVLCQSVETRRVQTGWSGCRWISGVMWKKKWAAARKGEIYKTLVRPAMINGLETVGLPVRGRLIWRRLGL